MAGLAIQAATGLLKAMLLFLLASGLSLIFGVSRVLNIAHGAFYALGAYLLLSASGGKPLSSGMFFVLVVGVSIAVGVFAAVFEMLVLRRVYAAGMLFIALVTFGLLVGLEETIKIVWSAQLLTVPRPTDLQGAVTVGGGTLPTYNLMLLVVGACLALVMWFVVERTRFGLMIRAAAIDREMLSALGVNVPALYTATFAFGAMLAALAGGMAAPLVALSPGMGSLIVIQTFAVVVIGGLGSLPGSLLGAVIVGEIESFGILVAPQSALVLLYLLMAAILILRPSGLLGVPDR
jgi:branched-subunit amino acid ABC-type transport system permease component